LPLSFASKWGVICPFHEQVVTFNKKDEDMSMEYKTINLKFKNRWTNSELNTDELDLAINAEASAGWEFVNVSISSLLGYPQSALCVYKKQK
jgi:hypothetical protein